MSEVINCCVPGCKTNSKFKHSSFYPVKHEWTNLIINYINQRKGQRQPRKLQTICGRHLHLCGIRQTFDANNRIYFPFLKISVSKDPQIVVPNEPQKETKVDTVQEEIYPSESISLGMEITIPKVQDVTLSIGKEKCHKPSLPKHCEHNYALSLDYVNMLREDYEKTKEENVKLTSNIELLKEKYEKEIQRLKIVTHDLMQSNLAIENIRFENQFRNIMENNRMLKFYTGFADKSLFQRFISLLKAEYETARVEKKYKSRPVRGQTLKHEQQIVLVLSRLRLGLLQHDLAFRFNLGPSTVCAIWSFWIDLLSQFLVEESAKLNRESEICKPTTNSNNRVILECNETYVECTNLQNQNSKILNNKMYSRAKGLIEITPNGYVSFVSDLYPAQISERELLERCHFYKNTSNENKNKTGYALSKKQSKEMKENKGRSGRFTSLQTHIQRILGFIKGFKILKGTFPNSINSHEQLNSYWKICCFLVNFINKPLVSTNVK